MKFRAGVLGLIVFTILMLFVGFPTHPSERNNAGNTLFERDEFDLALRAYQAAQVNAPDAPEAYFNAASALAATGRLRDAADALAQAAKTADTHFLAEIYHNLGNIYFEMARYNDAVETYKQALQLNASDDDTRYNYELALLRRIPTSTPTPQEQQIDPEENQSDQQPTPTNNPVGQDGPTATPTPPVDSPPDNEATPHEGDSGDSTSDATSTPTPSSGGPLSLEDVEQRLDAIQENQQTLREFLQRAATPGRPNTKDW